MQSNWNDSSVLIDLAKSVLHAAKKQGADSAEIDAGINQGFTVTARMGEVEMIEHHRDKSLNITVYIDQKVGVASITDFSLSAINAAVKAACDIARFTQRDLFSGLAEVDELANNWQDPELYHPWNISVDSACEQAIKCEKFAFAQDARVTNSEGAAISTLDSWFVYANSNGFIGSFPVSRQEMSCALIASEKDEMQQGYSYSVAASSDGLDDIEKLATEAVNRSVARLGSKKLSTRRSPVVFIAEKARGLLGHFVSAISGGNLYRKSSFLLDKMNQQVFPDFITIDERPHLVGMLGSSPFDNDGVATRPNIFIESGILKNYVLGVYSARKLGMKTTGNAGGTHNLFINSGDCDLDGLLKKMNKGFLVTDLMGQGVSIVTGDYSRGASGFWVENGEIQYPVEEATIAGNLSDIYANIVDVGKDIDKRGNIKTGSLLVSDMMVGGN